MVPKFKGAAKDKLKGVEDPLIVHNKYFYVSDAVHHNPQTCRATDVILKESISK